MRKNNQRDANPARKSLQGILDLSNPLNMARYKHEISQETFTPVINCVDKPYDPEMEENKPLTRNELRKLMSGYVIDEATGQLYILFDKSCNGKINVTWPDDVMCNDWDLMPESGILKATGDAPETAESPTKVAWNEPVHIQKKPKKKDTVEIQTDPTPRNLSIMKTSYTLVEPYIENAPLNCHGRPKAHHRDRVRCDVCGSVIRRNTGTMHRRTKKHQAAWALRQRDLALYETLRNCKTKSEMQKYILNL